MKLYYTCIILLTVCSMLIMQAAVGYNVALDADRKRATRILFWFIIVAALCEWGGVMLDGAPAGLIGLHRAVKVAEFSLTPCIGLLCGHSLIPNPKWERIGGVFAGVHALLELAAAFGGWIIVVDAQNYYHHGPFYLLYTLFCVATIGYFLVCGLKAFRRYQHSGGSLIWGVTLFLTAGILVQSFDSTIKITWLTVGISAIMLYKFYGDVIQQVDGLTELINRWGYDNYLSRFQGQGAILFFDVDHFKEVNDHYGHAFGDECLKTIAECIRTTFSGYGKCFRVGGDEFCVVLERNTTQLPALTEAFTRLLHTRQQTEPGLPTVSIGSVQFDPRTKNISDAIAQADAAMYAAKQKSRSPAGTAPDANA